MKAVSATGPNGPGPPPLDPSWVDEILLRGAGTEHCLFFGAPVRRDALRRLVTRRQTELAAAGLRPGGSVALCLAPSLALVANLLAVWRSGAQAALLDHRLTPFETDRALARLAPELVVSAEAVGGGPARGFHEQRECVHRRPDGRPARTAHAVVQLSSGSTGPSKVIGRTAADLVAELGRYARIDGVPRAGERMVCLASMVHVLGLVGGLLHCLHAGVPLAFPRRTTAEGILSTVAAAPEPTTLLGVPFHIELLTWVAQPPRLPQLTGMTTGGELLVARQESPYLGPGDPSRWSEGWLHTRDGGTVDPDTGLVRVLGRLDSQVSVGGLKVDLTEVEHTLAALPEVAGAVVVLGTSIEAYVVLREGGGGTAAIEARLAERLAAYKRPRLLHVVDRLPRTATGKLVRDRAVLRDAGRGPHRPSVQDTQDAQNTHDTQDSQEPADPKESPHDVH